MGLRTVSLFLEIADLQSVPSSLNPASFSDSDFLSACGISEVSQQECQEKPYSNVFLSSPAHRKHISPKETILASDNGSGKWLIGGHKTALVILTYNRAQYLLETANRILEVLSSASTNYLVDVFIAIDGDDTVTKNMATSIQSRFLDSLPDCPVELIEHKRTVVEGDTGYNYVARNMKNAFDTVLVTNKYDQAIILDVSPSESCEMQDDMFIAEDFFDYFSAMSFILYEDPSVYAISAYNDNGQDSFILDNSIPSFLSSLQHWSFVATSLQEVHGCLQVRSGMQLGMNGLMAIGMIGCTRVISFFIVHVFVQKYLV